MNHQEQYEEEAEQILKASTETSNTGRTSQSVIHAGEVAKLMAWVARLGEILRDVYGDASEPFKLYTKAVSTRNFSDIHSNWHLHIAELVGLAQRLVDDIKNERTPKHPRNIGSSPLTDEQGLWWFFQHCTTKTRGRIIASIVAGLVLIVPASYLAGRIKFIGQVVDLWKGKSHP
jgi:hypothetical protein